MTNDPDKIRAEIERTRAELSSDVDALSDKVSPSAIVERRKERVRTSLGSVRDRVMGAAQEAKEQVKGAAHTTTEQVMGSAQSTKEHAMGTMHDAQGSVSAAASGIGSSAADVPHKVRDHTEGNPLAVGLIAFGVGWLAASLIPASQKERQAALAAKEQAAPLVEGAKGLGSEIADNLREPAQEAVQAVKDRAGEAAASLKDEGRSEADGLRSGALDAKDAVQQQHDQ